MKSLESETPTEHAPSGGFDSNYAAWKCWDRANFGVVERAEEAYITTLLKRVQVTPQRGWRVLEIGFGSGKFLEIGRTRGWRIEGIERNPDMIAMAREAGFNARHADDLGTLATGEFDLVVAFDVLEHVSREALVPLLPDIRRVLKAGGVFLARFPNGDSPLGLAYQNGDPTHVTFIGSELAKYLARRVGFEIRYLGADVATMWGGSLKRVLRIVVVETVKALMNRVMRVLFNFAGVTYFSCNLVLACRVQPEPGSESSSHGPAAAPR